MRSLEITLLVFLALQLLILLFQSKSYYRRGIGWIAFLLLITTAQVFFEGPRWQMYISYFLVFFAVITFLYRFSQKRFYLVRQPKVTGQALKKSFLVLTCGSLWTVALLLPIYFPVFSLPQPIGVNPVGMIAFHYDGKNDRGVQAKIFYPSKAVGEEVAHGSYLKEGQGFLSYLQYVEINAVENAPLSELESLPVIIFSPNYFSLAEQNTQWAQELASQGFVVVALARPEEALNYERTIGHFFNWPGTKDAKIIASQKRFPLKKFSDANQEGKAKLLERYWNDQPEISTALGHWHGDLALFLGELQKIQDGAVSSIFTQKLDLSKVVFAGHGFGGAASVYSCELIPACVASINLSGLVLGEALTLGVQKPTLLISGKKYSDYFSHLLLKSPSNLYFVEVQNAELWDFTDLKWAAPRLIFPDVLGTISQKRLQTTLNDYSLAFLKEILFETEEELLTKSKILGAKLKRGSAPNAALLPQRNPIP